MLFLGLAHLNVFKGRKRLGEVGTCVGLNYIYIYIKYIHIYLSVPDPNPVCTLPALCPMPYLNTVLLMCARIHANHDCGYNNLCCSLASGYGWARPRLLHAGTCGCLHTCLYSWVLFYMYIYVCGKREKNVPDTTSLYAKHIHNYIYIYISIFQQ